MKIYVLNNSNNNDFKGLVSLDIGYKTFGITVVTPDREVRTYDFPPLHKEFNAKNRSIPEYLTLSRIATQNVLKYCIQELEITREYSWSMEIPNIVGCYAPALCMLVQTITITLKRLKVPHIYYTHNRLGSFYLKSRKTTKTMIKNLVKSITCFEKMTDHEADSLLQAYTVCKGIYDITLYPDMRQFDVEIEDINKCKLQH